MTELLRLETPDFGFSILCSDISSRQSRLSETLLRRSKKTCEHVDPDLPLDTNNLVLRCSPPPREAKAFFIGCELTDSTQISANLFELNLPEALFFENTLYQFEWVFKSEVRAAHVSHRSRSLSDSFNFLVSRNNLPARLIGSLQTGNDVGWISLPLVYETADSSKQCNLAFEVLPTKMDLHSDLPAMYQVIDKTFPLWRFSLIEKTEQSASKSQQRGHFPLMWLANFEALRLQLEEGLRVIVQSPHSRLQSHDIHKKAVRLKGRISHKLAASIAEDFQGGLTDRRYKVGQKKLTVDTPENRFIKMVVSQSKKQLAMFERRLRKNNLAPEKQRFSESFLDELNSWQRPLDKFLQKGFAKEVGDFSGSNRESLVLQQKTGYSSVYRVWQELKFYLDAFASQSSISMKSVAEIYEIWCFLTIRKILTQELGFHEKRNNSSNAYLNDIFEYQIKDGIGGAFEFEREDGVKARLAHEPPFHRNNSDIKTFLVSQKPDIFLEVTLPGPEKSKFVWLFDAKYRIKTERAESAYNSEDAKDLVPDDAINQMHRYRDALIRINDRESGDESPTNKSRPVFGAFALYPGFFDQLNTTNYYDDAIREIGIGAFAVLPSDVEGGCSSGGHRWLSEFLKAQIGLPSRQTGQVADRLYTQSASRIPVDGMQQSRYSDLILTFALGGKRDRNPDYFERFEDGTAGWYHTKEETFDKKYRQHIINEIRYLALATTSLTDSNYKQIDKLWPVKSVKLLPRKDILISQSGKFGSSMELYYLFELGKAMSLKLPVKNVPHRPIIHTMKLTTIGRIESAALFADIEKVYPEALKV